jgi:hypothetical protein
MEGDYVGPLAMTRLYLFAYARYPNRKAFEGNSLWAFRKPGP